MFGTKDIILHTADINRNRNGFEKLKEKKFREDFYNELNGIMCSLNYKIIACVVKKEDHLVKYGVAALDPYFLSLDILVERFCMKIGNVDNGELINAERCDPTLEHELDLAWLNLKIQGTHYFQAKQITNRISSFLYKAFPAPEARRLLKRLEFHFTPKHASWLNMAEIEIGNMNQQCLDRHIPNKKVLTEELNHWQTERNNQQASIKWMFDVDRARNKLHRACNKLNGQN